MRKAVDEREKRRNTGDDRKRKLGKRGGGPGREDEDERGPGREGGETCSEAGKEERGSLGCWRCCGSRGGDEGGERGREESVNKGGGGGHVEDGKRGKKGCRIGVGKLGEGRGEVEVGVKGGSLGAKMEEMREGKSEGGVGLSGKRGGDEGRRGEGGGGVRNGGHVAGGEVWTAEARNADAGMRMATGKGGREKGALRVVDRVCGGGVDRWISGGR